MSCISATTSSHTWLAFSAHRRKHAAVDLRALFGWVVAPARMREKWRQRQALLGLDDHLLRDIGISREEAEREGRNPFWK
jgi:uncharacterized protein YjiS (DUF1127 family)